MVAAVPDEFLVDLRLVVSWCKPRVNPKDPKYCLRSKELRPDAEFDTEPPWDIDLWPNPEMVQQVVVRRSQERKVPDVRTSKSTDLLAKGRLLLHFMEYSNHNGLTAGITDYFLDNNDSPPWDTWIQSLQTTDGQTDILVSWVPREFLGCVNDATKSECIGMLMWAKDGQQWRGGGDVPDWLIKLG
jgi:hypothetical protein